MHDYEKTKIWKRTLAKQEYDENEESREYLRVGYKNFRERAEMLAIQIQKDLPEFTVHDISHLDALWDTADLILPEDFELNPAEAFVLGGAFLIHDLGLAIAAYPGGINELKQNILWRDTVAAEFKKMGINKFTEVDIDKAVGIPAKNATEFALRQLHAEKSKELAKVPFKNKEGDNYYLIEDESIRSAYGELIGELGHSHWLPADKLQNVFKNKLGASNKIPPDWTIDSLKLSIILRIADAIQIDDRRAPSFLRAIIKPSFYSDIHWRFQEKLSKPFVKEDKLLFTSKSSFTIDDVESWWQCWETLKMIDNELREADLLMAETNHQRLLVNGVASIYDPLKLSNSISVQGWEPVDLKIKISNVAGLIDKMGGIKLYGEDYTVPLRELIQNASDAIRARERIEGKSNEFSKVIISYGNDKNGYFIQVEDNGVGMSENVLKGPFLDFGESLWGTSLMHEEFPGLESMDFKSIGQFGIGFFSVFMWGKKVSVTSRKFNKSWDDTIVLELSKDSQLRPFIRRARKSEVIEEGGTRIKIWMEKDTFDKILTNKNNTKEVFKFQNLLQMLCPSLSVNLFLREKGKEKRIISANDWIKINPLTLLKRTINPYLLKKFTKEEKVLLENVSKNLTILKDQNGIVCGRAAIFHPVLKSQLRFIRGVITVGGFISSNLSGILGILTGTPSRVSRDKSIPDVDFENISVWASGQAQLIKQLKLDDENEISNAMMVIRLNGSTKDLKIVFNRNKGISYEEIKKLASKEKEILLISESSAKKNTNVRFDGNVLLKISFSTVIINSLNFMIVDFSDFGWPEFDHYNTKVKSYYKSTNIENRIFNAISEGWGNNIIKIIQNSKFPDSKTQIVRKVGTVGKRNVKLNVVVIKKGG